MKTALFHRKPFAPKSESIILTISKDYVTDWGVWEAIRELSQNSLDSADKTETKPIINYHKETKSMIFISEKAHLSTTTLILGGGNKMTEDTQRGKFGEGYKLALVVLLRLGINVTIYNGSEVWEPEFIYSDMFKTELLTIHITKTHTNNKDLTIKLTGVEAIQAATSKHRVLLNRKNSIGYETEYGCILTEERFKGQIFVGGIFVCEATIPLEHGYDFNPDQVDLGRDRGLMDSFNIQWLTSKMWNEACKYSEEALDITSKLIASNKDSTKYINNHSVIAPIIEEVAEDFYDQYTDEAIPVSSEEELRQVKEKYSNAKPVIVNDVQQSIIRKSEQYSITKEELVEKPAIPSPSKQVNALISIYNNGSGVSFSLFADRLQDAATQWVNK